MQKPLKILIASGIYPPDIGGPALYAVNLEREFRSRGIGVKTLAYGLEKKLPTGIRHCYYFFRALWHARGVDFILALDTWSVGLPAVCAANILGKKIILRIGGDFLWESYVERTGHMIPLSRFYSDRTVHLTLKKRIIKKLTAFTLHRAHALAFTTEWQWKIWKEPYRLQENKKYLVANYFGGKLPATTPLKKNFLFAVRPIKIKNSDMLFKAFAEAKKLHPDIELDDERLPHDEFMKKIQSAYAVILPSLSEVCPNLILDAIRYNKPFILSKECGLSSEVKDIGVLVDPLDRADIVRGISLLSDEAKHRTYQAKVETFIRVHDWPMIAEEYIAIATSL